MKIIADTNIFLAVVLNEPEKDNIIKLTSGGDIISPEILPYEIGNALTAMVKRKKINENEALSAQRKASIIPVRLVDTDIPKALEIAFTYNIYAYDAYFLQTAKALHCPLLTLDKRMKQVANKMNLEILE